MMETEQACETDFKHTVTQLVFREFIVTLSSSGGFKSFLWECLQVTVSL
jgi:hypothetical protein